MQKKSIKIILSICGIFLLPLFFNSCNSSASNDMKHQISALETQNAILQSNIDKNEENESDQIDAPLPPSDQEQGQLEINTPIPESLPSEPVPAGQPITFDGWTMTVSKEIYLPRSTDSWGITVYVRNLEENDRVFRFTNASVTIQDNNGIVINPDLYGTCEEHYFEVKNLTIRSNDSREITSWMCGDDSDLGLFVDPIPVSAEQLIIHFEEFGPFTGVDVVIDL